jgi:hypothetical protein
MVAKLKCRRRLVAVSEGGLFGGGPITPTPEGKEKGEGVGAPVMCVVGKLELCAAGPTSYSHTQR